jgi:hypothetical protein
MRAAAIVLVVAILLATVAGVVATVRTALRRGRGD